LKTAAHQDVDRRNQCGDDRGGPAKGSSVILALSVPVILAFAAGIHGSRLKTAAHQDVDRRNECGDDGGGTAKGSYAREVYGHDGEEGDARSSLPVILALAAGTAAKPDRSYLFLIAAPTAHL
jgi:hypothetical protein